MSIPIIPDSYDINQIKTISIIDIWRKYDGSELKKAGKELAGRCSRHGIDKNPSLMINPKENIFFCHGCKQGGNGIDLASRLLNCEFKEAIKILSRDFNISRKQTNKTVVYDYTDAAGRLIYQVIREEINGEKQIKQRKPDGKGGYVWNRKGVEPLPYHLPELLKAIENGKTIYIAEGEKCVDALIHLEFLATTNSGGAGKWTNKHSQHFPTGTEVIILPDNDNPGRNHAQGIAKELTGRDCKVKIINLPGLSDIKTNKGAGQENGADVFDWLMAGHTKEELLSLADSSVYWETNSSTSEDANELENNLIKLEELPEKERRKYFNETILPLLAAAEPVEMAQATKKAANLLNVAMEVINSAVRQLTGDNDSDKNQADILIEIALSNTLFHDDLGEPYTLVEFEDHNRIIKIGAQHQKRRLTTTYPTNGCYTRFLNAEDNNVYFW